LLTSGSALGFNCGPLLIALPRTIEKIKENPGLVASLKVAIPGKYTTANFLLSLAYPQISDKAERVFSEIEQAVLSGQVDAGLIIHENRFTYQQKGLAKMIDLGEWWEKESQSAIPLGGIAINRKFPEEIKVLVNDLVKQSVEYAFANPDDVIDFVKANAQEMDEEVMKQHIHLYVNEYSIDLGVIGKKAVNDLFDRAVLEKIIPERPADLFVK